MALDRRLCGHCGRWEEEPFLGPPVAPERSPLRGRLPCRPPCSRLRVSSCPADAWAWVSGPRTRSFWACGRLAGAPTAAAQLRLAPPACWHVLACPRPAGAAIPRAGGKGSLPAARSSPPLPVVRAAGPFCAIWVFLESHLTGILLWTCPSPCCSWNLQGAHPPVPLPI